MSTLAPAGNTEHNRSQYKTTHGAMAANRGFSNRIVLYNTINDYQLTKYTVNSCLTLAAQITANDVPNQAAALGIPYWISMQLGQCCQATYRQIVNATWPGVAYKYFKFDYIQAEFTLYFQASTGELHPCKAVWYNDFNNKFGYPTALSTSSDGLNIDSSGASVLTTSTANGIRDFNGPTFRGHRYKFRYHPHLAGRGNYAFDPTVVFGKTAYQDYNIMRWIAPLEATSAAQQGDPQGGGEPPYFGGLNDFAYPHTLNTLFVPDFSEATSFSATAVTGRAGRFFIRKKYEVAINLWYPYRTDISQRSTMIPRAIEDNAIDIDEELSKKRKIND
jgi:hypothetical protein